MADRIVIPDDFPPVFQGRPELEWMKPFGEVIVYSTKAADSQELVDRLKGARALINVRAYSKFTEEVLAALPDLKTISVQGTGTDNIDLAAATRHGVAVTNCPGASTYAVAELSVALMMAAARRVVLADNAIRAGKWRHFGGVELHGKTIGLVGLGSIGQAVAEIAHGFAMEVLAWSLTHDEERAKRVGATLVPLDELLARSDVVSLHLRASPQTAGLLGRRELALMKPTAILVNTARGQLVDEAALAEALATGKLGAAGLDAFVQEPLPLDSPLVKLENVALSPHAGWVTAEATERLVKIPIQNVVDYLEGQPVNVVNREVLK